MFWKGRGKTPLFEAAMEESGSTKFLQTVKSGDYSKVLIFKRGLGR
jgi:hypothetical protein